MSHVESEQKTVLIAAGGTGGHVFPGIAVARVLQRRGYQVEWLGTETGLESRLVPVAGIHLNFFPVQGIRGKGALALLLAPFRVLRSVLAARSVVARLKPALVIGMGGFVSGPAGLAAWLKGVPLIIHEQNAVPGTSNKLLSRIAKRVLCGFPVLLERAEVIGNPVRESLESLERHVAVENAPLHVLVVGGSRGAKALNIHVPKALADAGLAGKVRVRHQCGSGRADEASSAYEGTHIDVEVSEFIDDMDQAMSWADIMVCRAGALTVSEVAAVGLPSILVPFPYAIDDHQTSNARYLADAGAAVIVQEKDFEEGRLVTALRSVMTNRQKMQHMAEAAHAAGKRGVAEHFANICEDVMS